MLIFLVGKASPAWHLALCSVSQLAPAEVAAGLAGFLSLGAALPHSCRKPPALRQGCATDAIWLPSLPGTAASAHRHVWGSPAQQVKAATAPVSQAACWAQPRAVREGGCSCRITPVPLLPGIVKPPGHTGCCGQHQSAPAASLHTQCWGREGSASLLEKNWGTKMPEHMGWLCLLAAAPPQLLS